eukprot:7923534-Karenia_brevis.AAC.1
MQVPIELEIKEMARSVGNRESRRDRRRRELQREDEELAKKMLIDDHGGGRSGEICIFRAKR